MITLCHPCHQRLHGGTGIPVENHRLDPVQAPTPWREIQAARVEEAKRLYASGLSAGQVAIQVGYKSATVNYWLRRAGVTRPLSEAQTLRRGREGAHEPKPPREMKPRVETGARSIAQRARRLRERLTSVASAR